MNAFVNAADFSHLEGEMPRQYRGSVASAAADVSDRDTGGAEGVRAAGLDASLRRALHDRLHPADLRSATLPSRGRERAALVISAETSADAAQRDRLLDRAMGPRWRRKSSEKLRRGRRPSEGLALVARDGEGRVVGTVRLWDVAVAPPSSAAPAPLTPLHKGEAEPGALLLGPLAVDPALKNAGIGSALMRHATDEARRLGHGAILLVGDAEYYARFGFTAEKTGALAMPGPYEKHRLLALELIPGALDGARGVLQATGRKVKVSSAAA